MFTPLLSALVSIRSWFRTRAALQLEGLALRHQLIALKRSQREPAASGFCRPTALGLAFSRLIELALGAAPREARNGDRLASEREFRCYWRWKSRYGEPGTPTINSEVRELIRKMSLANPLRGAPRLHGDLFKLGIAVSQATVAKYMARHGKLPSPELAYFPE